MFNECFPVCGVLIDSRPILGPLNGGQVYYFKSQNGFWIFKNQISKSQTAFSGVFFGFKKKARANFAVRR
jgi:hypothetical protein